jgi:putative ABC transport system permease protein
MIAIITYVSVVERVKEIGVIRSLGGRKKDVSRLFTAETAIIGLVSGLFGIGVTYLVSAIINAIVGSVSIISQIAIFPWFYALIMVGVSVALTLISGVFPASAAAKKDPVIALRTE